MSDLQSLPENQYCVPDQSNSWLVCCDEKFILRFKEQRTLPCWFSNGHWRKKHLNVVGRIRMRKRLQELCKETLNTSNMHIVFVTTEMNAPSLLKKNRVSWIIENGGESKEFSEVRQFVLVIPDSLDILPVETMPHDCRPIYLRELPIWGTFQKFCDVYLRLRTQMYGAITIRGPIRILSVDPF